MTVPRSYDRPSGPNAFNTRIALAESPNAGADFLQLRSALKKLDLNARPPESDGGSEPPIARSTMRILVFAVIGETRSITPERPLKEPSQPTSAGNAPWPATVPTKFS